MSLQDNYVRRAVVLEHHDGDTILVRIDVGFFQNGPEEWLRLRNVWAAELSQQGGAASLQHLQLILPVDSEIVIQTFPVDQRHTRRATAFRQSFVRFIADVWLGDVLINAQQVSDGFATKDRT